MTFFTRAKAKFPSPQNSLLAVLSAILLVLAFPDFELWFLAWFALAPLFWAIEREKTSAVKSFLLGWLWGVVFFFGTCWWLAYAPTHYGGLPAPASYFLVFCVCAAVGVFPAFFALLFSVLLRRFGVYAIFAAPFLWTAIEFLRFWTTGNNWNAIGYSQAFVEFVIQPAQFGGIFLIGFLIVLSNSAVLMLVKTRRAVFVLFIMGINIFFILGLSLNSTSILTKSAVVVAVQPNVPMSGLKYEDWQRLREKHVQLTESALQNLPRPTGGELPTIVVFPESPMNFQFERDREFQAFLKDFAVRNQRVRFV